MSAAAGLIVLASLAHAGDVDTKLGERTFARACAACHGSTGRGDGPGAADLDPAPRDLAGESIRFRSTPTGSAPRAEDLVRTIRHGLPGTAMPAFGDVLSEAELAALAGFIDALRGGAVAAAPEPLELAETDGTAIAQGRAIYLLTGCWSCHGLDGAGDGPSAATLTDAADRPLRVPDFRRDPLKGGRDGAAIVRTLRTGLDGAAMPSFDEAMLFAREDHADPDGLPAGLGAQDREAIATYLGQSPARAELAALEDTGRAAVRDARLAALAGYVLSLERKGSLVNRLFHERPEESPRSIHDEP